MISVARYRQTPVFISYYPLKQGLKLVWNVNMISIGNTFISYYPLKQGLKPNIDITKIISSCRFISYYPLKQGLKPNIDKSIDSIVYNLYPTIH